MKLRFLCLVLIGLMATSTFAATLGSWGGNGDYTVGCWQNPAKWKQVAPNPIPPLPTTSSGDEIKITRKGNDCTIDGISGPAYDYIQRLTLQSGDGNAPVRVRIQQSNDANPTVFGMGEFRCGASGSADQFAVVTQTGGKLVVNDLVLARSKNATTFTTYGTYEISGGTIQARAESSGRISIASFVDTSGNAGVARFQIVGDKATINMKQLLVGSKMSNADGTGGTGSLEYYLSATGQVSKITVDNTAINTVPAILTKLIVKACVVPQADILLVENTGASAVVGMFDELNGGSGAEGTVICLAHERFMLTYLYDANADLANNDIALVYIPEPATIALLSLGLIAIRRKK